MEAHEAWLGAYHQLELQLDRATFATWMRDTVLLEVLPGHVFVIGVTNAYARDMLQQRMYPVIERALSSAYGASVTLRFEIYKPEPFHDVPNTDAPLLRLLQQAAADDQAPLHDRIARPSRQDPAGSELNPRFTFAHFVPGSENQTAYAAALAVAERPDGAYNPLFLHGGVGVGKTHLLQSIANACQARGLRALYVPSEAFTNDLIDSIRTKSTAVFRDRYRSADVLLLDDIQFIASKENTQEELFHTFNTLHSFSRQIVLASDRHPRDLQGFADRLRSRFQGGLVMEVQQPSFETRLAILDMWSADRDIMLDRSALSVIARSAKMSVRELEGVFNKVAMTQHLTHGHLSEAVTVDIVNGYRRPRERVSLARVLEVTAAKYGLTVNDLTGKSRASRINTARQVAMLLARELTAASLPQIGDVFDRTHSTVLHACNKMIEDMTVDPMLKAAVDQVRAALTKPDFS